MCLWLRAVVSNLIRMANISKKCLPYLYTKKNDEAQCPFHTSKCISFLASIFLSMLYVVVAVYVSLTDGTNTEINHMNVACVCVCVVISN